MAETLGSATIEVGVNSAGVEAGMNRIDSSIARTGRNLDNLGGRGAENLNRVGSGADAAASRVDAATRNIAGAVERANAALVAGKKSSSDYFEELARSRGADVMKLAPLIAQLRETEAAQARAKAALEATTVAQGIAAEAARTQAAALREAAQAQSVRENFLAGLREQIQLFGKSAEEVTRYRAAQAGLAGAAEPLILELRQLRDAQDAATESARRATAAQQQAAQRQATGDAMLANLREQIALQGKTVEEVLRYRAALAGTSVDAEPLIQQLQRIKAGQEAATEAARAMAASRQQAAQTQATGEAFIANLREQALLYGKSSEEVLRYRATQLGLAGVAAPLIAQLQSVKTAQEAVTAAARATAEAQRQAVQVQSGKDSFVASLQQQAAAIGKTRTELLELQAAQMGVSTQSAPFIQKLREAEQGLNNAGMSARANAAALRGVPAQFTDIIVSLQGGQAPLTVLLQQGGQLKDMFGGAGNAAKVLGNYVLGMINPFTVAAAAAVALGVAYYQGTAEAKAFALSIAMTGNTAGVTAGQLGDMAKAASEAAGTQGKNAEVLAQLVGTGKVGADQLVAASVAAIRSQKFLGIEVENTVKAYADLGADPLKATLKLGEQYGYLTLSTYQQIKALENQGRTLDAAKVAQDAYGEAVVKKSKDVETSLGLLSRAWNGIASTAKGAWDAMLDVGREDSLDAKIAKARQRLEQSQRGFQGIAMPSSGGFTSSLGFSQNSAEKQTEAELKLLLAQKERENAAAKQEASDQRRNKAAIQFAELGDKYLTRQKQMELDIAKARTLGTEAAPQGQDPAVTEETIQRRIAQIRSKYVDVNNAGMESQIGAIARLGAIQEEVAKRARILLDTQQQAGGNQSLDKRIAYAEAVAKLDEAAIQREKSGAQQRLAIADRETVSEDQRSAYQEKLAGLRGQIALADEKALTRRAELTKELVDLDVAGNRASFESLDKLLEARTADADSLEKQLQVQRDANAVIGLTREQAAAYNRNLVEEVALRLEADAAIRNTIVGREGEAEAMRRSAAAMRSIFEAQSEGIVKTDLFEDSKKGAKELLDILVAVDNAAKSAAQGMAASFGKVGTAIGGLTTALTDYAVQQQTVAAQLAAVKSDPKSNADKIAKAEMAASKASAQAQIKSYGDMAAAGKSFFKENSKGYKLLETTEKAFRAYEMAMAVESMVKKIFFKEGEVAANLALNATKLTGEAATTAASTGLAATEASAWGITAVVKAMASLPFPLNLAAGAATLAAVIAIGAKMFGGVGGGGLSVSQQRQASQGTGTVFGDSTAKSDSIARSLELVSSNSDIELNYTQAMLAALRSIESALGGLGNVLVRNSGLTGDTAAAVNGTAQRTFDSLSIGSIGEKLTGGLTGKIVGSLFGGKKTVEDSGFKIDPTTIGSVFEGNLNSFQYTDIKKSGGLLRSDKTSTSWDGLGDAADKQFGLVISNIATSVEMAAALLGEDGDAFTKRLEGFVVDIGKISLKGMNGEEIQKTLEAVFSKLGDDIASYTVAGLDVFAKIGEGPLETLSRIAANYANLDSILASSGTSFGQVGMSSIAARERLIELAGGIDELVSKQSSFNDNFLTEAERLAPVQKYVTDQLALMGLQGIDTRDKFKEAVLGLANSGALATAAGADTYASLLALADAFAKTHAATEDLTKSEQEIADERKDLQQKIDELSMTSEQLRAKERSTIDASNRALFDQITGRQKIADAYKVETDARKDLITSLTTDIAAYKKFSDSLTLGSLSTLSPLQKAAEAQQQYENTLARAKAGDKDARANLTTAATTYLTADQVVKASSDAYAADFAKVQADMAAVAAAAVNQLSDAQLQQKALDSLVTGWVSIDDSVKAGSFSIVAAISALQLAGGTRVDGSHATGMVSTPFNGYIAELHAGEPVIDAPAAAALRRYFGGTGPSSGGNTDALVAEIKALRSEVAGLRADQQQQTGAIVASAFEAADLNAEKTNTGSAVAAKEGAWAASNPKWREPA